MLEAEDIESHVVDAASIATSRRSRRAKTDRIDGEALVRTLLAYKRGEPRVCAMVRIPTPEEEDRRRLSRERKTLTAERVAHVNRIKGLLFTHGVEYEPAHRNRRARLDELRTRDGGPLPTHLKRQISRELDRLELVLEQIKTVEAERNVLLAPASDAEVPTPHLGRRLVPTEPARARAHSCRQAGDQRRPAAIRCGDRRDECRAQASLRHQGRQACGGSLPRLRRDARDLGRARRRSGNYRIRSDRSRHLDFRGCFSPCWKNTASPSRVQSSII